ncbi:MAG: tRNA (adenosine(37)-N6)-dimethylallyltransferase MiaA [Deltaproteobacteria bacterium]|nr:tRNA (adenosine(37)-N6)-dimethylallyltransferase MiaA [Deltaproteobacteria bacterium]
MDKIKIIVIVGPTASGKSALAMELSERFDGEIVSADSMQVYRYMDIGTAKPVKEQREKISHHLIDIADPDEEFTAARYSDEASKAIREIHERGKNVFVAGGTGLYIKALTKGLFKGPGSDVRLRNEFAMLGLGSEGAMYLYGKLKEVDPEAASRIHPNNAARIIRALEVYYLTNKPISVFQKEHNFSEEPYEAIKVGLSADRKSLYKSIEDRVDNMMKVGLAEEARRLLDMGYSPDLKAMRGLGYKEILGYIQNKYGLEGAVREIKKNTRRYAKRQMTWFRKEADIRWFSSEEKDKIVTLIEGFLR